MAEVPQRQHRDPALAAADGRHLYTATDAILKGVLESEIPVVRLVAPPRPPFAGLLRRAAAPAAASLLERHGCEVHSVMDASRAVTLAARAAAGGRASVVHVANDQLFYAMPTLQGMSPRDPASRGGMVVVCEDNPELAPAAAPRGLLAGAGLPCLEPHDVESLRDAVETALRASRIVGRPAAIVADVGLLRSLDTIEARPNRIVDRLDAAIAGRRVPRTPRGGDPPDLLRLARRLDLNLVRSMPSPGEREALGLLVAGNAFRATSHMLADLGLAESVPLVALGLAHPLDDVLVGRLLQRCEEVVVLEVRPGGLAGAIAEIVERARGGGEAPARVRWRELPGEDGGERLAVGDALLPSRLARLLISRLHAIRPGLDLGSRLARLPQTLRGVDLPDRGAGLGSVGAVARVGRAVDDADRVLRHADGETTALITEGVGAPPEIDRAVPVEIWDRKRFAFEGPAAIRQAVRAGGTRIMVVCDVGGDGEVDIVRVARSAMPEEPSERLAVEAVDLHDRAGSRQRLVEAADRDRVTVVVARDGPPPRLDPLAAERELADVDRLGFRPRQRLVLPAESACERRGVAWRPLPDPPPLRTRGWMRRLRLEGAGGLRLRIRPFLEQVDAIRSKPPAAIRLGDGGTLVAPRPRHAAAARWRAHLAGVRGEPPGVAAQVLCEAGEAMGYRVQATWEPTPIGRGWRAWAQIHFTRAGVDPTGGRTSSIPYGEADLLLGVDPVETIRALGPDPALRVASRGRTTAVVNAAPLEEEASAPGVADLAETIRAACGEDSVTEDLLRACRHAFLTERVLDLVLLGMAFERGLVPLSPEALRHGIRRVEERGYGRCADAVAFGRRLAGRRGAIWPTESAGQVDEESLARLVRRATHGAFGRGRAAWDRLRRQVESSLEAMPGLLESEGGRRAAAEFADAMGRAAIWGGHAHAQRLADRIRRLYAVDRGESGRRLTAMAIRPVSEAMLPRDLFHVAASTLAPRHLASLRSRLRIRAARGDRLERRFLFRIDGIAFGRRFRLDLRTSDWLPIVVARLGRLVPWRWRGTPQERRLRDAVLAAVEEATVELGSGTIDPAVHRGWVERFRGMRPGARRLRGGDVVIPRERLRPE